MFAVYIMHYNVIFHYQCNGDLVIFVLHLCSFNIKHINMEIIFMENFE